jgi:hypothetical protein
MARIDDGEWIHCIGPCSLPEGDRFRRHQQLTRVPTPCRTAETSHHECPREIRWRGVALKGIEKRINYGPPPTIRWRQVHQVGSDSEIDAHSHPFHRLGLRQGCDPNNGDMQNIEGIPKAPTFANEPCRCVETDKSHTKHHELLSAFTFVTLDCSSLLVRTDHYLATVYR